jgi:uncharacterized protein
MKKIWLGLAGVVVVIMAVVGLAGCNGSGALAGDVSGININLNPQQQGLWVSGEGKVTAVPDLAIINLGIESQEVTVAEAQAKASEAMDKVMQALKDQGIDEKDIQTLYFTIDRVTKWVETVPGEGKEEVIGYRVTNTVTAKLRQVGKAGAVIDAVVAAGGDLTRVNNIGFTVDDPQPYYEQARVKAVEYARAKAQQLADKSGVELGKVTYLTENSYFPGPIYRNYAMGDIAVPAPVPAIETSISAGQLEITTNVQIAYEIID